MRVRQEYARLGWTQAEIGESLGVARTTITEDMSEFQELGKLTIQQLQAGHSIDEVATRHGLSLTHTWAIKLDGMDDADPACTAGLDAG